MYSYERVLNSANYIKDELNGTAPSVALILGSGLGMLSDSFENSIAINYEDIPYFSQSTVEGHVGKLISGEFAGKQVIAMKGRFHYYEGYSLKEVAYPIRVFKLLGINTLIVTNAAGGVNTSFEPGDLMLMEDHIKLFDDSPLRGRNEERFGPRFSDMSSAYNPRLREIAKECANECCIDIQKGVYFYMPGPSFETPAEIRAIRLLGADAVGMSTVPEVIAAAHCGMDVLGISCITNMAAGILPKPLTHEEVIETADKVKEDFAALLKRIIEKI